MDYIGHLNQYDMYKVTMLNHTNKSSPAQAEKAQTFEKMFTTPQSPATGKKKAQG
jgi:hypothetical protein